MNKIMIKKNKEIGKITRTGLQSNLPSVMRTEKLKKIAIDRGLRLRQIRIILGYNLDKFSELLGINQGTLGRLERGDTCTSIDMAKWIIKRLIENGMMVTTEWLITGKGSTPQQIKEEEFSIKEVLNNVLQDKKIDNDIKENIPALMSVLFTKFVSEIHENVLSTYVKDNKMSPIYDKGEFVMGVVNNNIEECNGKICIITKKNNTVATSIKLVRKISIIEENNEKIILAIPYNILTDNEETCKVIDSSYLVAPVVCKYNDFDSKNHLAHYLNEEDMSKIENLFSNKHKN